MLKVTRVLISDDLAPECAKLLTDSGVEVVTKTGMAKDALVQMIKDFDAIIVRSATKVTKEVIEAGAGRLKLIGRAGTGVDNIDVEAATKQGMVVMNTPAGNSRSAAELTCAMVMAVSRFVAQGDASVKSGAWKDRKGYLGTEVYGKTLAIIGLGRIGRDVAARMQGFGMTTIGFDPLVSAEESASFGVRWCSLDEIWPLADYVTVHVPLIPKTKDLINSSVFDKCRRGVYIINCARGGIVNESDLLAALKDGRCGGAGFDVFEQEPPSCKELIAHGRMIATPHLGASTVEAQLRVAVEIAEQIVQVNRGDALKGSVNASALAAASDVPGAAEWLLLAERLAMVARSVSEQQGGIASVGISMPESLRKCGDALRSSAAVGALRGNATNGLNLVNGLAVAKDRNIEISIQHGQESTLTITVGAAKVSGSPSPLGPFLCGINGDVFASPLLLKGAVVIGEIKEESKLTPLRPAAIVRGSKYVVASTATKVEAPGLNVVEF